MLRTSVPLLFAIGLLLGCQSEAGRLAEQAPSIRTESRDAEGTRVRLPRAPRRIAALSPGAAEWVLALGQGHRLVGVSDAVDDAGWPKRLPTPVRWLSSRPSLSVAELAERSPELIVSERGAYPTPALRQVAEQLGSGLFVTESGRLRDWRATAATLGKSLAAEARADSLGRALDAYLEQLRARTANEIAYPTAVIVAPAQPGGELQVVGGGGLLSDLLMAAGGKPIFAHRSESLLPLVADTLLAREPEWIFLAGSSDQFFLELLSSDPRLQELPAVRQNQVVLLPREQLLHTGPSAVATAGVLAKILHPRVEVPALYAEPGARR